MQAFVAVGGALVALNLYMIRSETAVMGVKVDQLVKDMTEVKRAVTPRDYPDASRAYTARRLPTGQGDMP